MTFFKLKIDQILSINRQKLRTYSKRYAAHWLLLKDQKKGEKTEGKNFISFICLWDIMIKILI